MIRDGAAVRTADELVLTFVGDAVSVLGDDALSPWGREAVEAAEAALEAARDSHSGVAWFREEDGGVRDDLQTVANQLESDLWTAGYAVEWEDGYVIRTADEGDEDA